MRCPNCDSSLSTIDYEGVAIETCGVCGGEWLDADELGHVVRIREAHFSDEERRAIDSAAKIPGIPWQDIDRDIACPHCDTPTGPINYGADTGIIVDRCPQCHGIWLDASELEKIQILVESWKDNLPEDLRKYGARLGEVANEMETANKVAVSRLPLVGVFINAVVNGILDVTA
jgi:Zn-finger nucleic acid-binding protein